MKNAAKNGYKNIVKILLDRGADINATDNYGWTALMSAAKNGYNKYVSILLEWGADIPEDKSDIIRTMAKDSW